jgi:hypothetical protein
MLSPAFLFGNYVIRVKGNQGSSGGFFSNMFFVGTAAGLIAGLLLKRASGKRRTCRLSPLKGDATDTWIYPQVSGEYTAQECQP